MTFTAFLFHEQSSVGEKMNAQLWLVIGLDSFKWREGTSMRWFKLLTQRYLPILLP